MRKFVDDIEWLNAVSMIEVKHQPMTERYVRAALALPEIDASLTCNWV